jgi:hypothetical protein
MRKKRLVKLRSRVKFSDLYRDILVGRAGLITSSTLRERNRQELLGGFAGNSQENQKDRKQIYRLF